MRTIKKISKLEKLLKEPLFRAQQARKAGVSSSLLGYYVKKGLMERIDHGIYRGINTSLEVDFRWEDLILIVKSIPQGVVCLTSALALYELTDEIPRSHWIAVPNQRRAPRRKGAKIVRLRNMKLGRKEIRIGSERIKIFDRERTIVDTFRYLGRETAIKALKIALTKRSDEKLDMKKLQNYAKILRVKIAPYILAVTI